MIDRFMEDSIRDIREEEERITSKTREFATVNLLLETLRGMDDEDVMLDERMLIRMKAYNQEFLISAG